MSALNEVFAAGSALVSFVFAALVFDQWVQRRHSFQLVWAVGLVWYGIGAGAEFIGGAFGWTETLYRLWYLTGAFFVAAYLGAGTIYLLSKTGFMYFAGVTVALGGVTSLLFSFLYPGSLMAGLVALFIGLAGGAAVIVAAAVRREVAAHIAMGVLVVASVVVAYLALTVPLASPGWALDAATRLPVGSAYPGFLRVLPAPFNIAGALCLVFGAVYSAYVYMPKRRALRARALPPVAAQLYALAAVTVNFIASLPAATRAMFKGKLNSRVPATILIAAGSFVPSVTSSFERFGISQALLLGQFVGVVLIFAGFLVSEEVFRTFRFGLGLRGREGTAARP